LLLKAPDVADIRLWEALKAEFKGEVVPSYNTVRRWKAARKKEDPQAYLMATNPEKAKGDFQAAFGSRSEDVVRLYQRFETDFTKCDIRFEGDPKRYSLGGVIDVYSGRSLFLVSESATGYAQCLTVMTACDRWRCIPEEIKTDNGKEAKGKRFTRFCLDLKVHQFFCDPASGDQKPHIERKFRALQHDLIPFFEGYTGPNVASAQAIRARKTFAQRLKEAKEGE